MKTDEVVLAKQPLRATADNGHMQSQNEIHFALTMTTTRERFSMLDTDFVGETGRPFSAGSLIRCGTVQARWFILVSLLIGCTQANPAATCAMGTCSDPAFPYCDVDGVIGGTPGKCLAVSCSPGEIKACAGNDAVTCNASGNGYDKVTCSHSCLSAPQPHCDYLEPKWLPNICDVPATSDSFMPNASTMFDVSTNTNCTGGVVPQLTPGPEICVVRAKTITLPENVTLTITGSRAFALVADDAISINGTIDAGAGGGAGNKNNAAGGGAIISGSPPTGTTGGGGAGFGQAGADGGNAPSSGGVAFDPSNLAYFAGGPHAGSSGGAGGVSGGGGGGGVLLAVCRGSAALSSTSLVDLNGGGGYQQFDLQAGSAFTASDAGAGGGAGGYLVVQALTGVTMSGQVYANGGGGGGGENCDSPSAGVSLAFPGGNGQRSTTTTALFGGHCGAGGDGGSGGIEGTRPTSGGGPGYPGGGGGAIGVVHIFTPSGVVPTVMSANMSPVPTTRMSMTR